MRIRTRKDYGQCSVQHAGATRSLSLLASLFLLVLDLRVTKASRTLDGVLLSREGQLNLHGALSNESQGKLQNGQISFSSIEPLVMSRREMQERDAPTTNESSEEQSRESSSNVDENQYSIKVNPSKICVNEPIEVQWTAPNGHNSRDYIALYPASSKDFFADKILDSISGKGSLTFERPVDENQGNPRLPEQPGKYVFKYISMPNQEVRFVSDAFQVTSCPREGPEQETNPDGAENGSKSAGPRETQSDGSPQTVSADVSQEDGPKLGGTNEEGDDLTPGVDTPKGTGGADIVGMESPLKEVKETSAGGTDGLNAGPQEELVETGAQGTAKAKSASPDSPPKDNKETSAGEAGLNAGTQEELVATGAQGTAKAETAAPGAESGDDSREEGSNPAAEAASRERPAEEKVHDPPMIPLIPTSVQHDDANEHDGVQDADSGSNVNQGHNGPNSSRDGAEADAGRTTDSNSVDSAPTADNSGDDSVSSIQTDGIGGGRGSSASEDWDVDGGPRRPQKQSGGSRGREPGSAGSWDANDGLPLVEEDDADDDDDEDEVDEAAIDSLFDDLDSPQPSHRVRFPGAVKQGDGKAGGEVGSAFGRGQGSGPEWEAGGGEGGRGGGSISGGGGGRGQNLQGADFIDHGWDASDNGDGADSDTVRPPRQKEPRVGEGDASSSGQRGSVGRGGGKDNRGSGSGSNMGVPGDGVDESEEGGGGMVVMGMPFQSHSLIGAAVALCVALAAAVLFIVRRRRGAAVPARKGDSLGDYVAVEMQPDPGADRGRGAAATAAGAVDDDFGVFAAVTGAGSGSGGASARGAAAAEGWGDDGWDEEFGDGLDEVATVTAYDRDGVKALLDIDAGGGAGDVSITATFKSSVPEPLEGFTCKFAVPAFLELRLGPPSGTTLGAGAGAVTQSLVISRRVPAAAGARKPLKLRLLIEYRRAGRAIRDTVDVTSFPADL